MATNDFKPFAVGSGANVTAQTDYEALAALTSGFQSGKASSAQINKALRQATVMASILGQFIADNSESDALDDGDTATLLENFLAAIKGYGAEYFFQASNNLSEIASSGATAISSALYNLGQGGYHVDTGTANNIKITIPGTSLTTVPAGFPIDICVAEPNTGATTIAINGGTTLPLWGNVGALQGGEIGSKKGIIRVIMNNPGTAFFLVGQNTGGPLQTNSAVYSNHAVSLGQFGQSLSAGSGADSGLTLTTASATFTPACNGIVLLSSHVYGGNGISGISVSVSGGSSSVVHQESQYTTLGTGAAILSVQGKVSTTISLTATASTTSGLKASFTGIFIPTT